MRALEPSTPPQDSARAAICSGVPCPTRLLQSDCPRRAQDDLTCPERAWPATHQSGCARAALAVHDADLTRLPGSASAGHAVLSVYRAVRLILYALCTFRCEPPGNHACACCMCASLAHDVLLALARRETRFRKRSKLSHLPLSHAQWALRTGTCGQLLLVSRHTRASQSIGPFAVRRIISTLSGGVLIPNLRRHCWT